jgi:ParB/RepB/Spo0J family partition protein
MVDVKHISLSLIDADEQFNCRGTIAPIDVVNLANDIKERGLIQPVTIAPIPDTNPQRYRLIAGFRRFIAHKVNKMKTIFAVIREDMINETEARLFNIAENIQREDLDILQEATALKRLYELGLTESDVSTRLGKSRGWVQIRYMLLKLPEEIRLEAAAGVLNQKHIREVYAIYNSLGKLEAFEAVKRVKDQKILGKKKMDITAKKRDPNDKVRQQRGAIFAMQAIIYDTIGNGITTRALAWAAGEISDADFFDSLEDHCINNDIHFVRPIRDALEVGRSL